MSASREITLQEEIARLSAKREELHNVNEKQALEIAKLRAALELSVKFIRLGNYANADDLLEAVGAALNEETK